MFNNIFHNKKIIITGHTGFKGSWLTAWLSLMGANLTGISLERPTKPNHFDLLSLSEDDITDFKFDICDLNKLKKIISEVEPDFIFHLAAQAIVSDSFVDPVKTYQTNIIGTLNILECLRTYKKSCTSIIITSDKCYDNVEWLWGYKETDRLGGSDPYSASKGAAELVIKSYVDSYFPKSGNKKIGVGRAGNVIGGGDWAKNRLFPDCFKSWSNNKKINIRNPLSTRPWQHVLEPLSGYLSLAYNLSIKNTLHGEAFNFGPPANQNKTVQELVEKLSTLWKGLKWENYELNEFTNKESGLLKLNCDKALHLLDWTAVLEFDDTVKMTAEWYQNYLKSKNKIYKFTKDQIIKYTNYAKVKNLFWSKN